MIVSDVRFARILSQKKKKKMFQKFSEYTSKSCNRIIFFWEKNEKSSRFQA